MLYINHFTLHGEYAHHITCLKCGIHVRSLPITVPNLSADNLESEDNLHNLNILLKQGTFMKKIAGATFWYRL